MNVCKQSILLTLLVFLTASCHFHISEDKDDQDSDDTDDESLLQEEGTDSDNKRDEQESTDSDKPVSKDTDVPDSEDTGKTQPTDTGKTEPTDTGTKEGDSVCKDGELECFENMCVPNDIHNCGYCGHDCTELPNVAGPIECNLGVCILTKSSCDKGWAHCSNDPDDGCEINITDAKNCGECGNDCTETNKPLCTPADEGYECAADCKADAPTQCGDACVNTDDHPLHCGKCDNKCDSLPGSRPVCKDGECDIKCDDPDYHKCPDGCFPDGNEHCGDCETDCTKNKNDKVCDGKGLCVECLKNGDCKENIPNGEPVCDDGECEFECNSNYLECSGECVPNDDENCGTCGNDCTENNKVCDGEGNCVECMKDSDCKGADKFCFKQQCADTVKWVYIQGGKFNMGSTGYTNEKPVHEVNVGDFNITKTEVTVSQYGECVTKGVCTEPGIGKTHDNWDVAGRENHPVNDVYWNQADIFCKWKGGRLPSEAEWEYAASNGGKNKYPWGEETSTCEYGVMAIMGEEADGCGEDSTWPVCSKTAGNTSHGLCDMAGNVAEWVQDWYHDDYNGAPTDGSAWENPIGSNRVIRGGSLISFAGKGDLRATSRFYHSMPSNWGYSVGFRCAK